jgi:predicted dehydrogenase
MSDYRAGIRETPMEKGKEIRSKLFSLSPRFNYLPDGDRYLLSTDEPKYRFNVIGTGLNGQEHIRVTMLEGRATINGIFDPNPLSVKGAKQAYSQSSIGDDLVVYDSPEKAFHDPDVDGLIICTPNHTHIDIVKKAVKSGKHILLEKPMATTIQDAYEITQLANRHDAVFQIGLQYRYKAIYVEAIHEALVRKAIGNIKTVSILEHRIPFLDKVKQWNKFSKYSGGTLVEKCCHYFDLLNLFAQSKPWSVFATGSMAVNFLDFEYDGEKSDIIDHAFVTISYENGIRAGFNLCMFSPMFYEEIILCGDEGRLKAFENQDFIPVSNSRAQLEILLGENKPSRISTPCYPAFIEQTGHNGSTYFEHVNFIDHIEGREIDAARADEGFWSIVVGAAAEESIKTGCPVRIGELLSGHGIDIRTI